MRFKMWRRGGATRKKKLSTPFYVDFLWLFRREKCSIGAREERDARTFLLFCAVFSQEVCVVGVCM